MAGNKALDKRVIQNYRKFITCNCTCRGKNFAYHDLCAMCIPMFTFSFKLKHCIIFVALCKLRRSLGLGSNLGILGLQTFRKPDLFISNPTDHLFARV